MTFSIFPWVWKFTGSIYVRNLCAYSKSITVPDISQQLKWITANIFKYTEPVPHWLQDWLVVDLVFKNVEKKFIQDNKLN